VHENLPVGFTYTILAYGRRAGVWSLEKRLFLLVLFREIRSRAQHRDTQHDTSPEQHSPLNQDPHPKSQKVADNMSATP
jgi:hypothetical protein